MNGASMSTDTKPTGDMFHDRDAALDIMSSSLQMVEALAKHHGFPFLAVVEHKLWLRTYRHFPESTPSELRAAWYEIAGGDDNER